LISWSAAKNTLTEKRIVLRVRKDDSVKASNLARALQTQQTAIQQFLEGCDDDHALRPNEN
jgi:predicted ArsR family transcriptional regulator